MLVIHPISACDVCLEEYTTGDDDSPPPADREEGQNGVLPLRMPHVIGCGHTFCLECVSLLTFGFLPSQLLMMTGRWAL